MGAKDYIPPMDYPGGWQPRYRLTGEMRVTAGPGIKEQPQRTGATFIPPKEPVQVSKEFLLELRERDRIARVQPKSAELLARRELLLDLIAHPREDYATLAWLLEASGIERTLLRHSLEAMLKLGQIKHRVLSRPGYPGYAAQYSLPDREWGELPRSWKVVKVSKKHGKV